jgi:hypothetical protein
LGSEEALLAHLRRGLVELGQHSADDLAAHLEEYRRLFQIAQQVEAEHDATSAA